MTQAHPATENRLRSATQPHLRSKPSLSLPVAETLAPQEHGETRDRAIKVATRAREILSNYTRAHVWD
jgi:hypothetical protein